MSEPITCPDCGYSNPAGATSCEHCNYPLTREAEIQQPPPEPSPRSETAKLEIPRRPRRSRPRAGPASTQALSLWLLFAVVAAGALIYEAVRANLKRAGERVEGSNPNQQQVADQARAALAQDSTNVEAHIALANVLFDTGNWSEAVPHYRVAVRRDSSRIGALVDLGVCYYNLGESTEAERLFRLALAREPHQPVALFNMGIVNERRGDFREALRFYHRALETGPGDEMRNTIVAAVQRMQQKTGQQPAPLPGGGGP